MIDWDTAPVGRDVRARHFKESVMNNSALWRGILVAVLVIGAASAIGIGSYNAGVAHGFADSGRAIAVPPGAETHFHGRHHSWGFLPILPLVFFFWFVAVMRGPWRGGWRHRYYYDGVPPAFEEWHRRAHAETPPAPKP
jgi:hypothetical protein